MKKLSAKLLRPSQIDVSDFIIKNPVCAIFSEMGFGKTAACITAIEHLFRTKEINKLLIVTTKLVSQETWPEELNKWEQASRLKFVNIVGSASDRIKQAIIPAHIYVINQELFVWLAEKAGKKWPYDMIIFDDVSGFSSNQTKTKSVNCKYKEICPCHIQKAPYGCFYSMQCRYSNHCSVAKNCSIGSKCEAYTEAPRRYTRFGATIALRQKIKRIVHLTGTPTGKNCLDLWPLIFSLDAGKRLKRTFTAYKQTYFIPNPSGYGWQLKNNASHQIAQKIKDICIAIPSEAILPPVFHINHEIKLPKKAENLYKDFANNWIIETEKEEIEAINAGVLSGKLLQICGGAVYKDDSKEFIIVHNEKIKAVKEIINKHPNEPILIGYNFQHELHRLKKAFPYGIDIKKIKNVQKNWNAGKISLMFSHPGSAGHGLNLQLGPGHILIWFSPNWSLKLDHQLNKRLWRPGQKRAVYIYYIVNKGKIDNDVMKGVAIKGYTQQKLLDDVKRNTKNYINYTSV